MKNKKYQPKTEMIALVKKIGLPRHAVASRIGMPPSTFQAKLIGYCPMAEKEYDKIASFCLRELTKKLKGNA